MSKVWTAGLAVIGDEILSGRTQDKNINQVATWLNAQGIRLAEVRVVPDIEDRIIEAVDAIQSTAARTMPTAVIRLAFIMMSPRRRWRPFSSGQPAAHAPC